MKNPFEEGFPAADDLLLLPQRGLLASRDDAQLKPYIYSAPMDRVTGYEMTKAMLALGEIPVVSRFLPAEERKACLQDFWNTPAFFAIGGTKQHLQEFMIELIALDPDTENPAINVAIDIAHGHSYTGLSATRFLRNSGLVGSIMSGSIATAVAAVDCAQAGATHLRVGIGPGSMCTTRQMTGVGVPNISAIYWIDWELKQVVAEETVWHDLLKNYSTQKNVSKHGIDRSNITIIADGGIRYPGDAVKYLAAGADAIMLGSVLSKCKESPGWEQFVEPHLSSTIDFTRPRPLKHQKTYRGQASAEFQADNGKTSWCPEGATSNVITWDGATVESEIKKFRGGLASGLSYLGMQSVSELKPENVQFIQVTGAGVVEGTAHGRC
jgi:IMP dehydrogenase